MAMSLQRTVLVAALVVMVIMLWADLCSVTAQLVLPGCEEDPAAGPCKARLLRWFFNRTASDCQTFYYGGCAGNLNNYDTRQDCLIHCVPI